MSSTSEHHQEADQLLALAHIEKDATLRRIILAEAQVHATLALAAATGAASDSRTAAQPSYLSGRPGTKAQPPITDIGGS
jgi:hypothetical protein